jgi:hypothetical protein
MFPHIYSPNIVDIICYNPLLYYSTMCVLVKQDQQYEENWAAEEPYIHAQYLILHNCWKYVICLSGDGYLTRNKRILI